MTTLLFTGLLATSMLSTSLPTTQTAAPYHSFNQSLALNEYSTYSVQEGDYMSMIAHAYYGSEDYWTNIWNDNPEITDPAVLEVGTILKIRDRRTELPEVLKLELEEKSAQPVVEPVYTYSENKATVTLSPAQAAPTVAPAAPVTQQAAPNSLNDAQITYLGNCEAGMDPAKNTGNGYYGAFQFSYGTWKSMGTGYERADLAPLEVQKAAVQRLVARSSIFTQFPGCAKKMRSIGLI